MREVSRASAAISTVGSRLAKPAPVSSASMGRKLTSGRKTKSRCAASARRARSRAKSLEYSPSILQPGSNIEGLYSSDFALDLARRAEAAHLDFVFRPDVSFLPMEALETGAGFASLDPTVLMAALARETSRIGLVSTVSTTFFPPYAVARQLQSLHWIRSEEHTSELQSQSNLVCRLLLEKKKKTHNKEVHTVYA